MLTTCDLEYPEVAVVNNTGPHILLKNLSFSGCVWETVLAYGNATSPGRCLPGEDEVHFQKLDIDAFCQSQATQGASSGWCSNNGITEPPNIGVDAGPTSAEPIWFNYQTISVKKVDYGQFKRFEVTLDDMEQDFSIPGPYGH